MASRMAARSTIAGTPVKSCSSTRAGMNEISLRRLCLRVPLRDRLDVFGRDGVAVLEAQEVLEQDPQRVGQPRDVVAGLERVEPSDVVPRAADLECGACTKGVGHVTDSIRAAIGCDGLVSCASAAYRGTRSRAARRRR